jgi:hypothetical protein
MNISIDIEKVKEKLPIFRRLIIKYNKCIRANNFRIAHLHYLNLQQLAKKYRVFPQAFKTDPQRIWLTKRENLLLQKLKRSALEFQSKIIYKKKTAKTFIFRCRSCNFYYFDEDYYYGLEFIMEHYYERHNGDIATDIQIGLTKNSLTKELLQKEFWETLRLYGSIWRLTTLETWEYLASKYQHLHLPY